MKFAQKIRAHYIIKNRPRFSRQIVLPAVDPGVGVELVASGADECTYGDWANIAAQADVRVDSILVGIALDTPVAVGGADIVFTVDIGLTYILATNTNYDDADEIIAKVDDETITNAQVHRAEVRVEWVDSVGILAPIMLPFPVWVPSGVGILGRLKSDSTTDGGAADTVQCSVLLVQHMEMAFE